MTYIVWDESSDDANQIEHILYTMSNGGVVYHKECDSCSQCYRSKSTYRRCPTCRGRIDGHNVEPYVCTCGTALCTCVTNGIDVVFAYAKPNKAFELSEGDII